MDRKPAKKTGQGSLSERFDGFTKKTLKNLIRTELRTYVRQRKRDPEISLEGLEEELAMAIEQLKERHRQILGYAVVEEMPVDAIANLINLAEKSVRNYKYEALRLLRENLEGFDDGQ